MVYYGKNVPFPNVNLFNDVSLLLISFYKRDDMLGSKNRLNTTEVEMHSRQKH